MWHVILDANGINYDWVTCHYVMLKNNLAFGDLFRLKKIMICFFRVYRLISSLWHKDKDNFFALDVLEVCSFGIIHYHNLRVRFRLCLRLQTTNQNELDVVSGDSWVWICSKSTAETATEALQSTDTRSSNSYSGYYSLRNLVTYFRCFNWQYYFELRRLVV